MDMKTVKPVALDTVMGKTKNRINRIGIELEGGWHKLRPGTRLTHDGSVQLSVEQQLMCAANGGGIGELPSPPLDMGSWVPWIKTFYPHEVNASCGMHVHLSFQTALTYQRLMSPAYPATIIAYVTKWAKERKLDKEHPIWPRLNGQSQYCQHRFWADDQVNRSKDHDRHRPGNRYTVVNYCYSAHSTLECRLLPMMSDVDGAIDAIQNVLNITNAFLVATKGREEKVRLEQRITDESLREERKIYV